MVEVVTIHSFRGGTGKSTLTANLAVLLAGAGCAVGVVDTDVQSPGVHVLFGLSGLDGAPSLNDHLFQDVPIADVSRDVTPDGLPGRVHLVPASARAGEITRVVREGYDPQRLVRALRDLTAALGLDVLLVDTHPGLQEETLLSLVLADSLVVVLRPDQQDYEGTGVTVDVADGLEVPRIALVVNKCPPSLDPEAVRRRVCEAYQRPVVAVLPHSETMMVLASRGLFVLRYPEDPLTAGLAAVTRHVQGSR